MPSHSLIGVGFRIADPTLGPALKMTATEKDKSYIYSEAQLILVTCDVGAMVSGHHFLMLAV